VEVEDSLFVKNVRALTPDADASVRRSIFLANDAFACDKDQRCRAEDSIFVKNANAAEHISLDGCSVVDNSQSVKAGELSESTVAGNDSGIREMDLSMGVAHNNICGNGGDFSLIVDDGSRSRQRDYDATGNYFSIFSVGEIDDLIDISQRIGRLSLRPVLALPCNAVTSPADHFRTLSQGLSSTGKTALAAHDYTMNELSCLDKPCNPVDHCSGHGLCTGREYECRCLSGWEGPDCSVCSAGLSAVGRCRQACAAVGSCAECSTKGMADCVWCASSSKCVRKFGDAAQQCAQTSVECKEEGTLSISSVRFSGAESRLDVVFKRPTDSAGQTGFFSCAKVVSFDTFQELGYDSVCTFATSSLLLVILGRDFDLRPGGTFKLRAGAVKDAATSGVYADVGAPVLVPAHVFAPRVNLRAPAMQLLCHSLTLDGSGSIDTYANSVFAWRCNQVPLAADAAQDALLPCPPAVAAVLRCVNDMRVTIPADALTPNTLLRLSAVMVNMLGLRDEQSVDVRIAAAPAYHVYVEGAPLRMITANLDTALAAGLRPVAECEDQVDAMAGAVYSWIVYSLMPDGAMLPWETTESNKGRLMFPASRDPSVTFVARVTVSPPPCLSPSDGAYRAPATAELEVRVRAEPLRVSAVATRDSLTRGQDLVIVARALDATPPLALGAAVIDVVEADCHFRKAAETTLMDKLDKCDGAVMTALNGLVVALNTTLNGDMDAAAYVKFSVDTQSLPAGVYSASLRWQRLARVSEAKFEFTVVDSAKLRLVMAAPSRLVSGGSAVSPAAQIVLVARIEGEDRATAGGGGPYAWSFTVTVRSPKRPAATRSRRSCARRARGASCFLRTRWRRSQRTPFASSQLWRRWE
jgi:hypothetical protein